MEPLTAATHRWVMHGIGEWFHRSHHRANRAPGWERNDWFPVAFASIVMFGFWLGFNTTLRRRSSRSGSASRCTAWRTRWSTTATSIGASVCSAIDGSATLDRLADAHRIHHLYNAAPYGMLAPVVPAELRERAAGHRP